LQLSTAQSQIPTSQEALASSQSTTIQSNLLQYAHTLSLDHQLSQTPTSVAAPATIKQCKGDVTQSTYYCIKLASVSGETVSNESDAYVEIQSAAQQATLSCTADTLVSSGSLEMPSKSGNAAEISAIRIRDDGAQLHENSITPIPAKEQSSRMRKNALAPLAYQPDKNLVETVQPGGNSVTSEQSNNQYDEVETLASGSTLVETAHPFVIHRPPVQLLSHAVVTPSTSNDVEVSMALGETLYNKSDAIVESVSQSAENQPAQSHTAKISASPHSMERESTETPHSMERESTETPHSMERESTEKHPETSVIQSRDGEAQMSFSSITSAPITTIEQPVHMCLDALAPLVVQSSKNVGEAVHQDGISVTSEQSDKPYDVVEPSSSSTVSVGARHTSVPLDHPIHTITSTEFVLFTPAMVVKVWLRLENPKGSFDKVEMLQRPNCKQVWQTCSVLNCEKMKYYYGATLKGSSGVVGLLKSAVRQNEEKLEEKVRRVTRQLLVHRDVFEHPRESSHSTTNYMNGWKYFLSDIIEGIETEQDLRQSLAETALLSDTTQILSSQRELARYATECVYMSTSKPLRAIYIVITLSRIIDSSSLGYSGVSRNNASMLLRVLCSCDLQKYLPSQVSISRLVDTLTALICISEGSSGFVPSWASFVYWCYPMLPIKEILNRISDLNWGTAYEPAEVLLALQRLCSLMDDVRETEEILVACLNRLNSLSWHIDVFRDLKRKGVPASRLDELSRNLSIDLERRVEQQLAEYNTCTDLKGLAALILDLTELNPEIVPKMSQQFEMTTIRLLSSHSDVSQCGSELGTLVESPMLFTGEQNVELLMTICSTTQHLSHNELFIRLASCAKLVHLLKPCAMVGLAENWLSAAKFLRTNSTEKSDISQWYGYISRILQVPCLASDHGAKSKLKEYFMNFFRDYTRELSLSHVQASDLYTVLTLIARTETEDTDLLEIVHPDLEDTIIRILHTVRIYDLKQVEMIKDVLLNDKLFAEADCAGKVLECMVRSQACDVHYAFLDVLSRDKFWNIISIQDCDRLFVQWIETAIKVHSRSLTAAGDKSSTAGLSYIVYMYNYFGKMCNLDVLGNHPEIKEHVERRVKEVFADLDIGSAVDLLEAVRDFDQTAKELMEKHVGELKSGKLIPLRDLLSRLDSLGQMEQQLDITDR